MGEEHGQNIPEDFNLLEQFNSGEEDAFTRIVEKHSGPLINFLYRYTQNQSVSEDIAQEAFLRLYKAASGLKPGAKLSTILYKMAYNLAVDQARKNKSRSAMAPTQSLDSLGFEASTKHIAVQEMSPDSVYIKALRDEEIAAGLAELPDAQHAAIVLKAYENRSYAEIAEMMGLSISAVDSLIFRARQSLAKKLGSRKQLHDIY
ncbi:MAG: sigma-70 family RNA polymerase sigma factor [Elusimicrobiales bacterium]|nr:sigma-70 family RNA polymerase sigma factor [Elusimicrobiales bacterium]